MITYRIKAGTTDVSVVIRIVDSTDGTPETGVVFNTSGIDLQYRRELAASTAITEATLAALTTAHADGGFLHIGNGYYRLDLPDAACATGVSGVLVHGIVTGMVVIGCYIELPVNTEADIYARLGAPAGASVSADVAAVKVDTAAILVDTGTTLDGRIPAALVGGRMDASVGAVAANAITAAAIADGAIDAATFAAGAINAAAIAADAITDAKVASDVTIASVTGAVGSVTGAVGSVTAGVTLANGAHGGAAATLALGGAGGLTGNVTGNLSGSVGSVTGAVGSVTGAVGSVTGAVGSVAGNVDGSVASVTGAVGSVTGAVGSVTGAVGSVTGNVSGSVASIATGGIAAASFAAGAIDAAAIAASAIGASEIAADALTDAKFDSTGKLRSHFTGVLKLVVDAGSTTTAVVFKTVDGAAASATNDFYKGRVIVFTSGALAGQATSISSYTGATVTATVVATTGAPADTVTAVIV